MEDELKNKPLEDSLLVVLVHLGKNPSKTLIPYVKLNKQVCEKYEFALITDRPGDWKEFPGTIIEFDESHLGRYFKQLQEEFNDYLDVAGGYWLFTLKRLWARSALQIYFPKNTRFIHIESDVLLLADAQTILSATRNVTKTAVPRYSLELGIASILYAPSINQYLEDLLFLESILMHEHKWLTDMHVLGIALNSGTFCELQSGPREHSSTQADPTLGQQQIFDGAAIGQFLFGQDPVHNSGSSITGYINPFYGFDVTQGIWKIERNSKYKSELLWEIDSSRYQILSIHVHSKAPIANFVGTDPIWSLIIDSANSKHRTIYDQGSIDYIHTQKTPLRARLRIIVRKGVYKSMKARVRKNRFKFF